jgi:hypothetical protein
MTKEAMVSALYHWWEAEEEARLECWVFSYIPYTHPAYIDHREYIHA